MTSSHAWLATLITVVLVVVLPLAVVNEQVQRSLADLADDELDDLSRQLLTNRQPLSQQLARQNAPVTLCRNLAGMPAEAFQRRVAEFHQRSAGALRWVGWDQVGRIIDLPEAARFGPRNVWQPLAPNYFLVANSARMRRVSRGLKGEDPDFKRFQMFLGNGLSAFEFMDNPHTALDFTRLDTDWQVSWQRARRIGSLFAATATPRLTGVVLAVERERLPPSFWASLMVDNHIPVDLTDRRFHLASIDLTTWRVRLPPQLRQHRQLAAELAARLHQRQHTVFIAEPYLVLVIDDDAAEPTASLLVMADLSPLRADQSRRAATARHVLLLLLALGAVLVRRLLAGATAIGLRWRLAMLFALAVLLPTALVAQQWLALSRLSFARDRERLTERMREEARLVSQRFRLFTYTHSQSLAKLLATRIPPGRTETQVAADLDRLTQQGWFESWFLSDARGKLAASSQRTRTGMASAMKTLLSKLAAEVMKIPEDHRYDAVISSALEFTGGTVPHLRQPSQLRSYMVGRVRGYVMYVLMEVEDSTRILLLRLSAQHLGYAFAQREMRRQRQTAQRVTTIGPRSQLYFAGVPRFPASPHNDPIWTDATILQALQGQIEAAGVFRQGSNERLFYTPTRPADAPFHPLLTADLAPLLQAQSVRQQQLVVRVGIALAVAVSTGLLLAGQLLVPLRRIEAALMQLGGGDLSVTLPNLGHDEIGTIAATFNQMVGGLRERERMTRFLSRSALRSVSSDTASRSGCRQTVAVLFADIRDFTTLSERHPPEVVVGLLNQYFDCMSDVITKYGGDIDKFIGDAIMAIFREESERADPGLATTLARAAVSAGLGMQKALAGFNAHRTAAGEFPIAIGVGIAVGEVIAGNIGAQGRLDHTVIGDVVNVASRLEGMSKQGRHTRVIVSAAVHALLHQHLMCEQLATTTVKGKSQPVPMFEIIAWATEPAPPDDRRQS